MTGDWLTKASRQAKGFARIDTFLSILTEMFIAGL